jgi:hypothetical protein
MKVSATPSLKFNSSGVSFLKFDFVLPSGHPNDLIILTVTDANCNGVNT